MTASPKPTIVKPSARPPFECIALLLQGGGALGAYQGGVYQALDEAGLHPDWVAGISIGAINSALIAGNPPGLRVERLREFWEQITKSATSMPGTPAGMAGMVFPGEMARVLLNQMSAASTMVTGAPGFFEPRLPPPYLYPAGAPQATSFYDTAPLKSTLERLVDFDRINHGGMRFSVGAVNVRTGNFVYFDTKTHQIIPEHVMASGALPPGFPAVEIEGENYWDGGLISNTPLNWVVDAVPRQDTLAFQVDLWSSRGDMPRDLAEVNTRTKEIQYSSRTRQSSDQFKHLQRLRNTLSDLLDKLPADMRKNAEVTTLRKAAESKVYNLIQLVYRSKHYEGNTKDYEFSRLTMEEHWTAGYNDAIRTLRHPEVLERPNNHDGVFSFDLAFDGRS